MNYAYDILLNFNSTFIDFFEWGLSDEIYHVKKIPIFKVSNRMLLDIKTKRINIEKNFLNRIYNKFSLFNNVFCNKNCCLFGNENDVIAVSTDTNGRIDELSDLLMDESIELLEIFEGIDIQDINYEIISSNIVEFITREERENIKFLCNKIKNSNKDELKFLYFECFNKKLNDINKIKNCLTNNLFDKTVINKILSFYNLLSLEIK